MEPKPKKEKKSATQVMANAIAEVYVWGESVVDTIQKWYNEKMSDRVKSAGSAIADGASVTWKFITDVCDSMAASFQKFANETRTAIDEKKGENIACEMSSPSQNSEEVAATKSD